MWTCPSPPGGDGVDQGLFQASFSTVYRVLKEQNLNDRTGPNRPHNATPSRRFAKP